MLIREVLEGVLTDGGSLFVWGTVPSPEGVDVGFSVRPCPDPASTRSGDVLLSFVDDPFALADYWPSVPDDGVHVVVVVRGGTTSAPLAAVVREATRRGLQIVDALAISDLGEDAMALVAVRTRRPVPPRHWLSDGTAGAPAGEAAIRTALSSHVLDRAIRAARADVERHERANLERERSRHLEHIARLEGEHSTPGGPLATSTQRWDEVAAAHRHLSRRVDAIYRSRTWRVGRIFWTLAHPVRAANGDRPGRPDASHDGHSH